MPTGRSPTLVFTSCFWCCCNVVAWRVLWAVWWSETQPSEGIGLGGWVKALTNRMQWELRLQGAPLKPACLWQALKPRLWSSGF